MWCQKSMENTPATLNTSEKARKIPLLAEKIYVGIAKELHRAYPLSDL